MVTKKPMRLLLNLILNKLKIKKYVVINFLSQVLFQLY